MISVHCTNSSECIFGEQDIIIKGLKGHNMDNWQFFGCLSGFVELLGKYIDINRIFGNIMVLKHESIIKYDFNNFFSHHQYISS